ncbi:MAG: hypothetical protein CM15mP12_3070 [Gammaproteobacteria bacterium]|nr:MAG: hypothetical protein CM15mP12_3070 [Gammaproteobacteria bacterium]
MQKIEQRSNSCGFQDTGSGKISLLKILSVFEREMMYKTLSQKKHQAQK